MLMSLLQRFSPRVLAAPRILKRMIALVIDIALCIVTIWLAFYLRLGELVAISNSPWNMELASLISVMLAIPVFIASGLYRAIFRYSGWSAMKAVSRGIAVYGILFFTVITVIGIPAIPRTVGIIQPLLLFFAIGASRAFIRFWLGGLYQQQLQRSSLPRAMIYGAGTAGRELMSALENSYEMRVVGFLDDDPRLLGHSLNGHRIFARDNLSDLVPSLGVTHVLLAIPSLSRQRRQELIKALSQHQVAVRALPRVTDLAEGRVTINDLQELDIEDLLGREVVPPNHLLLSRNVSKRTICITGAGGSIGGELARQLCLLGPRKILLVDNNEFGLYTIHAELEKISRSIIGSSPEIVPLLGSVTDSSRINQIFNTWTPDTIYHAAAFKHVPLVEHNAAEGVKNNVFGTLSVARCAIDAGVANFVLVSTDKAVRPTNIMGASKRLAEMCLQALVGQYEQQNMSGTKFSMVRFGNVLDSSGSVIPRFRQQIREGGPISVTHSEVTRFFMTKAEAAQLVIQAGAMARGGDIFVLDMGVPVKIRDLARRMVELSGLTVRDEANPDGDIAIEITGLRPGEKLYEELNLGDRLIETKHSRIQLAQDPFVEWSVLEKSLDKLQRHLDQNEVAHVKAILKDLVTGYSSDTQIVDWISMAT